MENQATLSMPHCEYRMMHGTIVVHGCSGCKGKTEPFMIANSQDKQPSFRRQMMNNMHSSKKMHISLANN